MAEIFAGRPYFSPCYWQALAARHENPQAFDKLLSEREREVLTLIANSFSDDEIAAQLSLTANTAETHRRNIMVKLNLHSTVKLIKYAREQGFGVLEAERERWAKSLAT